jgi:hypothetical protein
MEGTQAVAAAAVSARQRPAFEPCLCLLARVASRQRKIMQPRGAPGALRARESADIAAPPSNPTCGPMRCRRSPSGSPGCRRIGCMDLKRPERRGKGLALSRARACSRGGHERAAPAGAGRLI